MERKRIMDDYYIAVSNEAYHRKNMELALETMKKCEQFLELKKKYKIPNNTRKCIKEE